MINDQAYIARFTSTREKMPVSDGYFSVCGKVFVISGGDKGLGFETTKKLVRGGGIVVIATWDRSLLESLATAHRTTFFCLP